jgi:hypothetical protein
MTVRDKEKPNMTLPWLFPLTYLLHLTEELWGGEGFTIWLNTFVGAELAESQFVVLNGLGWLLMVIGCWLINKYRSLRWLLVTLATVVLINALLHLLASVATMSYSPGVVTGILLWVPLGIYSIWQSRREIKNRIFKRAVFVGIVISLVVLATTLLSGRIH